MKRLFFLFLISFSLVSFARDSVGEQRTAVVFFDLLEDGKEPSIDLYKKAIFDEAKSVSHYVKEVSHQKAWLTGKTYPWLRLKGLGKTCYLSSSDVLETIIQNNLLDLTQVDRLLVFNHMNHTGECAKNNSFGFSTHGKETYRTSIGEVKLSLAQFHATNRFVLPKLPVQPLSNITSSVIAHELGHSFGSTGHSNILDCGKDIMSFDRSQCTQSAIADMFTLLGGEGFFRPSLHFSACHKEELGWIGVKDESLVVINKENKSRIVKLRPFSTVGKNVSVRINLESPFPVPCVNPTNCTVAIQSLFLEYRTARGFDENISKLPFESARYFNQLVLAPDYYAASKEIKTNGIQIRGGFYKNDKCMTSYNLDVTPESLHYRNPQNNEVLSYSLYDNLDSFLLPGMTFAESVNGLSISMKEIDKDGNAVVEIRY
ncbi:hypothetical protein ACJVC5_11235 [Peredibacter sp. HCB2-198]|uniref:hypothetical protein n=1 Tax=Peredibacter sp. HCB2-198 TaxID=3383025 RepID=UPI0038B5CFB4